MTLIIEYANGEQKTYTTPGTEFSLEVQKLLLRKFIVFGDECFMSDMIIKITKEG